MTMRLIPHAAAVSEFIAGYHGDCGETAEMALLHVINPAAYPLNAADLSTIVKRDISKGWASANGSEPISAIAHDLDTLGLHYTNYGYAEPFTADWRGVLAQWGGIKPIVFEYAHAGQLPGDEVGVSYHFNTCLGWDTATNSGLFADGDNLVERTGGTALVTYSEANLATAGLCGMLVGEYELGGVQMAIPSGWSDDAATETLKAPNGVAVVHGMRAFVLANAWDASDVPMGPEVGVAQVEIGDPSIGGGVIQFFEKSGQLSWSPTFNGGQSYRTWNGKEEQALRAALTTAQSNATQCQDRLATATTQLNAAQSQLSAAQQSAAAATAGQQTAQASLQAANAQIAQLQAQITALKSQPAPVPAPAPAPANPAPTTPADAAALLVSLIYAEAEATLKAVTPA